MPKTKHMRLPNGFGQISKLKNQRLRKPYRAMVTVGKTDTGRPICKLLKPEAQSLMSYGVIDQIQLAEPF